MDSSNKSDLGWRGRWIASRNRLLASPSFQRFAGRFFLTRPIARSRARKIFDLVAGFAYSQILAACVKTKLLEVLAERPLETANVAARIELPIEGAERLLRGAAALGLVERIGAAWAVASDGAALLGNPGIAAMVAHHHLLYADLADPVALLRSGGGGGALSRYWHYAESVGQGDPAAVAAYSSLMAASQSLIADQVIDAYDFSRHRRLLDIGGGEGAFLSAVGKRVPDLDLALFDLPAVGERAATRLAEEGLSERVRIIGGNFLKDALPGGNDLVTLVRVLHDHDDPSAMILLKAIHASLPRGGRLLIAEPMAQTRGAEPAGDAYFGFYLWAMGSGRPRSAAEIQTMLRDAGFSSSRLVATAVPLTARMILASA